MTTIRRSRRSSALLAAAFVGAVAGIACGSSPAAPVVAASASSDTPAPRRPDGVVLEPPTAIPPAVATAEARGVVALRPSLSSEAIHDCVRDLLEAWQHASLDELTGLLASDAGPIEARGRGPGALTEAWRQRLHAREYRRLEGMDLARPDRVEHYAYAELGVEGAPPRPADMRADETYVRVPLEVTQVNGEKYFEATIVLLLRGDHGRAKIAAYGEIP